MIDKKLIPVKGLKKNPFQVLILECAIIFVLTIQKKTFSYLYIRSHGHLKRHQTNKNTEYISHDRGWNGCCDFLAFGAVRCTQGFLELCFQKHDASRQSDFLILKIYKLLFILSLHLIKIFFTSCHISFTIHWYSISINKTEDDGCTCSASVVIGLRPDIYF